ncbi:hypothetical protein LRS12_02195 [Sphingomonas sp. J344]|uniref:hypothetical protein n=2 Tax=unclassified Sphingomonas TaxID=196159 RepID=UPI002151DD56|nr:hypothetical protein [Sphingomonas sp. J344]MCR5869672.1 hypothetical protein [Sphingomonas sp. J344]
MRGQFVRALSSIAVLPPPEAPRALLPRLRERFGARAIAIALALLVELLLALLLLTIAPKILNPPDETVPMATFGVSPEPEPAPEPPSDARPADAAPQPTVQPRPREADTPPRPDPVVVDPAPEPPVLLDIPLGRMPDIAALPRRPSAEPAAPPRRVAGPPAPGPNPGDSRRVEGRGPNGEPLYAASWFRKPYDSEIRGYLSTARAPGWAMIACRTVADYRVDSCVLLDEYPEGAQIGRAWLAAAWQFRVRPPRLRGQYQVGEWVRIRIDYGLDSVRAE